VASVTGTLIGQIQQLGLTESEARAYLALVRHGPCTVLQIARHSALQRTEIYILIPRLVKLGLVEDTLDRPKRYRSIDPKTGMTSLAKYSISRTQKITRTAEQLVSALTQLQEKGPPRVVPEIRIMTGASSMRAQFYEAVKSAKKEVWMMSSMALILATKRSDFAEFLRTVSAKNLRARLITELDPMTAIQLKQQIPLVEIRHCQELHTDLYGIDDSVVSLGLSPTTKKRPESISYVVMNRPESVRVIRSFYEAFWQNTIPLEAWIATKPETSENAPGNTLIWGRETLYASVADWGTRAKKWILNYMPSENGPVRFCANHRENIMKAQGQAAKTRSLCHITRTNLAAVTEICRFTEVRHTEASPCLGFAVLDESDAAIQYIESDTPSNRCPSDMSVYIRNPDAVRGLLGLFNLMWEHSIPAEVRIRKLSEHHVTE